MQYTIYTILCLNMLYYTILYSRAPHDVDLADFADELLGLAQQLVLLNLCVYVYIYIYIYIYVYV